MKRRSEKPKRDHTGKNLSQYGLFDIPTNFDTGLGNDIDDEAGDSDLEAELAALSNEGGASSRAQRKKPSKKIIPQHELDAMVADSIKDIGSDDEDVSVDEDDPELLGELQELQGDEEEEETASPEQPQPVSQSDASSDLTQRLKMYEIAESNAKSAGETSKARRYARAIKTLKDLIRQAKSGKVINLNDDTVPPEIHIGDKMPSGIQDRPLPIPSRPAPQIPPQLVPELPTVVQENVEKEKKNIDEELLAMLTDRQKQYKIAALKAKKADDANTAIKFVKIAKQFDSVIDAVQNGQNVDLSNMPGPPSETGNEPPLQNNEIQHSSEPESTTQGTTEDVHNVQEQTLITASSVLEALEQRLGVYKQHETQAKEEGNSSKARRYGRIAKQFEQAIKLHKAGKPLPLDELPTPPGYAPIPVEGEPSSEAPKAPAQSPVRPQQSVQDEPAPTSQEPSPNARSSGNRVSTHTEKQVLILLAKQKQFKQAALAAKKAGEITQAKEFLRQAKGFDKLIDAARAGLPVDWSSIPVSPEAKSQLDNEYDIVMSEECSEEKSEDFDVLARLENQLQKQLKMCLTTRDHNKALGDVAGTNRFERLALNVSKDLDFIRMAKKVPGIKVPKFHYETKEFSIVKSYTEIMDNHMEVTVARGINYNSENPNDIDTYVKIEFPFPQDTPFSEKTSTVRNTNNPEYNKTWVIPIQRNSRHCQRVFKRHSIKLEVYSKGGFFRSDTLIGTVNVKLQPLETQCEIHDSFDLLEGRKKLGGKLEVQIKLRNPIVTQQVEQIQEKWLVLDQ